MCLCTLCAGRFLRLVGDSEVFRGYCDARQIPYVATVSARRQADRSQWWIAAVSDLPDGLRKRIEWEQDAVCALGSREGIAHLFAAAGDADPPPAEILDGGPLALWFLLHRPDL